MWENNAFGGRAAWVDVVRNGVLLVAEAAGGAVNGRFLRRTRAGPNIAGRPFLHRARCKRKEEEIEHEKMQ